MHQVCARRVADVDSLGHGSLQRLLTLHARQPAANRSNVTACAAALACSQLNQAKRDNHMVISKVIRQLQAAPLMEDLGNWTQWTVACEPDHGLLSTFLLQHGMHNVASNGAMTCHPVLMSHCLQCTFREGSFVLALIWLPVDCLLKPDWSPKASGKQERSLVTYCGVSL